MHLYHVAPRQDLGGLLEFDRRRARKNMVLGYFDAKRMLYGLEGRVFYLDAPESEIYYFNRLLAEAPELLADIWPQLSETELFTAQMASCRRYTEEWFPKLAKAHLVLVLVFSKIRATFFPFKVSTKMPFFFFSFNSAARSSRYVISSSDHTEKKKADFS